MVNQLLSVIDAVGLHNVLTVRVLTSGDDEVCGLQILVAEADHVLEAAAGRQCKFERVEGSFFRYRLSVEIGDVEVFAYVK